MALGEQLRRARLEQGLTPSEVAASTRMKVQIVEGLEREDFSGIAAPIYGKGFIRLYAELVGLDPKPLTDEYSALIGTPSSPRPIAPAPASAPLAEPPSVHPSDDEPDLFSQIDEAPPRSTSVLELDLDEEDEPVVVEEVPFEAPRKPRRLPMFRVPRLPTLRLPRLPDALPDRLKQTWERMRENAVARARAGWGTIRFRSDALKTVRFSEAPARYASMLVGVVIVLLFVVSGLSRCAGWPSEDSLGPAGSDEELDLVMDPPIPYLD